MKKLTIKIELETTGTACASDLLEKVKIWLDDEFTDGREYEEAITELKCDGIGKAIITKAHQ